ncbi:MAG: von Willebrand factor type A domain-containing protein [Lachnospiraceae bacterium]|nr:von Willebrand factor type A domain-containing protein [Lachnospiraceae bacterium]
MRRKTVYRSIVASMTLLSLTACGKANTSTTISTADAAPAVQTQVDSSDNYDGAVYEAPIAIDSYLGTNSFKNTLQSDRGEGFFFDYEAEDYIQMNTEEYSDIRENVFRDVSTSPLSSFSADVDSASYSNLRRMINMGYSLDQIPEGAVRAEEMINYFHYDYKGPEGSDPFGINAEISTCPWNSAHKLLHLGLQTEDIDFSETPDSNIVLLVDVSGSMSDDNKLPLVKESFSLLIDNLSAKDKVSIVTYASGVNVVLEGVSGNDKRQIREALNRLSAGGATNGTGGIDEAYRIAEENFIKGGNNRVIIASDGDFNVGKSSESDLSKQIREKAEKGIFLSVLGFGMYNYSDTRMETLADDGNGNYAYIDTLHEAKKVLVSELSANMLTIAKDVKLQIEFNPKYVSEYRLIGYENRALNNEDFNDDKKDAGEIGAGHSVTVLYEIVPTTEDNADNATELKYQESTLTKEALESNDWLTLSIRYKRPDSDKSDLLEYEIGANYYTDKPSNDYIFSAAVAEYAMLLRNSEFIADGSFAHVVEELNTIPLNDEYRREFATLVDKFNN